VETFRDLPPEMRFLVIAFSSDWLYPPYQSKEIVRALKGNGLDCSYLEMHSSFGHDAFLLENKDMGRVVWHFMESTARLRGVKRAV
jgi:homoserine O-acetyltransferase